MLVSLLAYARGAGIDARWVVIEGNEDFFVLTKRIHNFLHGSSGDGGDLDDDARRVFDEVTERNAAEFRELIKPEDVVIIHDPQPAGLIPAIRDIGCPTVWRCHVGLDRPDALARRAWELPAPLRPRRGRLRLLARGLRVGGARRGGHDHPALDRRLRAQEPGARPRARAVDPHRRGAQRGRRGPPHRPSRAWTGARAASTARSALGAAPAALVRPRRGPGLALGRAQGPDRGDPAASRSTSRPRCPTRTSSTPGRLSSR